MSAWVCRCAHAWRRHRSTFRVISQALSSSFWETWSLTSPWGLLSIRLGKLPWEPQRSSCLCLFFTEVMSVHHLAPPFYMRIDLWFFFLNDNHFSSRVISSSPKLTFKHGKVTESEVIWSLKIISFLCCPHLKKKAIYVTSKVRIKLINGKGYWYEIEILKTIFHSFWISITKVVFVEARKKVKMDQEFTTWEKATY